MIVAVEKGLDNIKSELAGAGFDTVTYGEYHHHIDALVYSKGVNMNALTNSVSMGFGYPHNNGNGIFLINANGKTAGEIGEMLRRKAYSPLF